MIAALRESVAKLAESVLPAGTPAVGAVQPAWSNSDSVRSRSALEGSIVRCSGGDYLLVPPGESGLAASNKKLPASTTGRESDATDKTEASIASLNPESVMVGIITGDAGAGAAAAELWFKILNRRFKCLFECFVWFICKKLAVLNQESKFQIRDRNF